MVNHPDGKTKCFEIAAALNTNFELNSDAVFMQERHVCDSDAYFKVNEIL